MNKIENPFLVYGYEGPTYFCDRQKETDDVISALTNGCNLTLMSPRRYGKTGLIHNVFHRLKEQDKNISCFYVDIYATNTLSDFVRVLGKSVVGKLDTPLQKAEGLISKFFRNSQITMSQDPFTGLPQLGLAFNPQQAEQTLEDIFAYLSHTNRSCFIAIDEFQQIAEYPEKNVEALLRTYVQQLHQVHFIFAGSKMHMMSEMFDSPKHPFYKSTEKLYLDVIREADYYEFAAEKMKEKSIVLSAEAFHQIYSMVDGVTWFVQSVLNRLYRFEPGVITDVELRQAVGQIISTEEENYKRIFHLLTQNQTQLLKAIAMEGLVKEPLSGLFLRTHHLKSSSSVQRALQFLTEKEYVYQTGDGFIVYDRFFSMWLRNKD